MQESSNDELEREIVYSLRRTGANFILIWPLVIATTWAYEYYLIYWQSVVAIFNLVVVLIFVCIPNLGRIAALNKLNYGFLSHLKKHLVLASLSIVLDITAIVFLWSEFNSFYLATITASICFVITFLNSLAYGLDSYKDSYKD